MKKTTDEILQIAVTIQEVADSLPERNYLNGDSNKTEIQECNELAHELRRVAQGYSTTNLDITDWVEGNPSDLDDFLI